MLDIDKRQKEDVWDYIEKASRNYTPEWRFDTEKPDIGTALALVGAEMTCKTIKTLNKIAGKNRIAFFNSLDAKLMPTVPSTGYVKFALVSDESDGAEVEAGTVVSADCAQSENGVIRFETLDDVFVTPSAPCHIYHVDDKQDHISHVFDKETANTKTPLFYANNENLQGHALYFCHETALFIKGKGKIELSFFARENIGVEERYVQALADANAARIEYYAGEEGFVAFEGAEAHGNRLIMHKGEGQPTFARCEISGCESFWIRILISEINRFGDFSFELITIESSNEKTQPDVINSNGMDCSMIEYYPFGEQLNPFSEVYFASNEVLSKKNAQIELAFNLDFIQIPLNSSETSETDWKWIMDKKQFKPDVEYDITIEEIIWEYYNGSGWGRLFADNSYKDTFHTGKGTIGQHKTIKFKCPADISPVLVNSTEAYYIKARVTKLNNFYKTKGVYVTPLLSNTTCTFNYQNAPVKPDYVYTENNLESALAPGKSFSYGSFAMKPFTAMGEKRKAMYIGFDVAPVGAPIKMLFVMEKESDRELGALQWQYYGKNGWKDLNLMDGTENFSKSGIVSMAGSNEFARRSYFQRELFWIKIIDENDYYSMCKKTDIPEISAIHMNVTLARNADYSETEYFQNADYEENKTLTLMRKRICDCELWIDEAALLTDGETASLIKEKRAEIICDESGVTRQAWVMWRPVEYFSDSGDKREYLIDKNEGVITFGNGVCGKVPPTDKQKNNIKVLYKTGGGEHTNIPAESINKLTRTIGFINFVTNPYPFIGGCGQESLERSIARNAAILRHQNRAITARDFERLSLAASRNVVRAKCYTGYDKNGVKASGSITVVILQKFLHNSHNRFRELRDDIINFVTPLMNGNLLALEKFAVIEPVYIEVCVSAKIMIEHFNSAFRIRKEILSRLESFIDPLTGNFDKKGWDIGTLPQNLQIKNAINDITGITYIQNLYTTVYIRNATGRTEVDMSSIKNNIYVLPVNGRHEIEIFVP